MPAGRVGCSWGYRVGGGGSLPAWKELWIGFGCACSAWARQSASPRGYWGGRIGDAGAMETLCQSLGSSANQGSH